MAKSSDCSAQLFSYIYVRKCAQFLILSPTMHTTTLLLAQIIKMNFGELTTVFVGLCGQIQRDKDELGGIFMRKTEHFKVRVDDKHITRMSKHCLFPAFQLNFLRCFGGTEHLVQQFWGLFVLEIF